MPRPVTREAGPWFDAEQRQCLSRWIDTKQCLAPHFDSVLKGLPTLRSTQALEMPCQRRRWSAAKL
jgi:hypothetical protein